MLQRELPNYCSSVCGHPSSLSTVNILICLMFQVLYRVRVFYGTFCSQSQESTNKRPCQRKGRLAIHEQRECVALKNLQCRHEQLLIQFLSSCTA